MKTLRNRLIRTALPIVLAARSRISLGLRGPHFLIIGAQKSGTTALYRHLVRHPRVTGCLGQEVHYFDRHFEESPAWYFAHFRSSWHGAKDLISGESTPYYLFHPHVPARAARLLPDVRLIVLLRDPVTRAISHYHHQRRKGGEPLGMLDAFKAEDERLAPEVERLAGDPAYVSPVHRRWSYVMRGLYADQLGRWLRNFDRASILPLRSEDLFAGDPLVQERLFDFLGLDHADLGRLPTANRGDYDRAPGDAVEWLRDRFDEPNRRLRALIGDDFAW